MDKRKEIWNYEQFVEEYNLLAKNNIKASYIADNDQGASLKNDYLNSSIQSVKAYAEIMIDFEQGRDISPKYFSFGAYMKAGDNFFEDIRECLKEEY